MKIFALGVKKYFANGWNLMDFVIVFIGAIGAILELARDAGGEVDHDLSALADARSCEGGGMQS